MLDKNYRRRMSMATDMMVWNITKDKVTERMGCLLIVTWHRAVYGMLSVVFISTTRYGFHVEMFQ